MEGEEKLCVICIDIGDVVVESQPLIQYDAERLQSSGG